MASFKLSNGYDSAFDDSTDARKKRREYISDLQPETRSKKQIIKGPTGEPYTSSQIGSLSRAQNKLNFCNYVQSLNAYERHKMLINEYFLTNTRAFSSLVRDTSKDVTDADVLRGNHKFLWEENEDLNDWGKRLAKKYYDKLFKEYCICDLSFYKHDKVGMRWRTETEVKNGKGQFGCGEKKCMETENLRTWEMNFAYVEEKQKKNALVKLRLCHDCSYRLNYKSQKKQVKKSKKNPKKRKLKDKEKNIKSVDGEISVPEEKESADDSAWKGAAPAVATEEQEKENEFEEYLEDLFL